MTINDKDDDDKCFRYRGECYNQNKSQEILSFRTQELYINTVYQ